MHLLVRKFLRCIIRILFPSALLAIREKGLRNKLVALFRLELQAHATPCRLSLSLSLGVFMAIIPLHGLQVVLLLLLTMIFKLNRPLAMVGVSISSAPFLPFWIAAGVGMGELLISDFYVENLNGVLSEKLPGALLHWIEGLPVKGMLDGVIRWFFGSIILAIICGVAAFVLSYPVIRQMARNKRNRKQRTAEFAPEMSE